MKIRDLCEGDKPREKLLARGAGSLSNAELLSVLLRSGTRNEGAVDLSMRIMASCGDRLERLFALSPAMLSRFGGVGPAKAASVLAAFELGRRFLLEQAGEDRPVLSARDVYEIMVPRLKGVDHEECWLILMNGRNVPQDILRLTVGGFDSTVLDVRQTVTVSLEHGAAGVVLVHNHPSGDPRPSGADCALTERIRNALKAVGVNLVDHVVVSGRSFFSFAENRRMQAQ